MKALIVQELEVLILSFSGEDFFTVQQEVTELIKGKILVGHAIHHDLKALYISHPKSHIRDTSRSVSGKVTRHGRGNNVYKLIDFDCMLF